MEKRIERPILLQNKLDQTMREANAYFRTANEALFDGYQTAHQTLTHIVFWHREYAAIIQALLDEVDPILRKGAFADLNKLAEQEFADKSMVELCDFLQTYQNQFSKRLARLTDWTIVMPVKHGGRRNSVVERVAIIEAQVRGHLNKLQRAERHGHRWVDAYYGGFA